MVTFGVTTRRAHLDAVGAEGPVNGEIRWDSLQAWLNPSEPNTPPAFVGRYFLGMPNSEEIEQRTPFCLWAHAEGAHLSPQAVVPLQRGDPNRLSATGPIGQAYGEEDATALALYLDSCLAVGDLALNADAVLVFLDVPDGQVLSPEYWFGWAGTIHTMSVVPQRYPATIFDSAKQVLHPALLCSFEFDPSLGRYLPEQGVRAMFDSADRSTWFQCFGFWARRKANDPELATHPFDWTTLGSYLQPLPANLFMNHLQVPVYYLRLYEGPGPTDNIDEFQVDDDPALLDTLSLVTLDVPAPGNLDPTNNVFTATAWRPDAHDTPNGPLTEMPVQFGIDTATNLIKVNAAGLTGLEGLLEKRLHYTRLPYDEASPHTEFDISVKCEFAIRYYSQNPYSSKNLWYDEADALSGTGFSVAAVWQESFNPRGMPWVPYVQRLMVPFVNHHGRSDAVKAFSNAAEVIKQPAYTPVYFAVDFPVGQYYAGSDGTGVDTPPMSTIVRYFRDVNRGYLEYLATHPATPYYIGVYSGVDVFKALYSSGLATYFWQVPWASWNNSARPFAHVNVWQVGNFNQPAVARDTASLTPYVEVDLNVAWGDAGCFQYFP
jgi:hypothetical protein